MLKIIKKPYPVTNDLSRIANELKKLRLSCVPKPSQAQIARMLGISLRTYSRYENGYQYPTYEVLAKCACLYDVQIQDIVDGNCKDVGPVTLGPKLINTKTMEGKIYEKQKNYEDACIKSRTEKMHRR